MANAKTILSLFVLLRVTLCKLLYSGEAGIDSHGPWDGPTHHAMV